MTVAVGYGAQAGPNQGQQVKGIGMNHIFLLNMCMYHLSAEPHTQTHSKSRLNKVFFTLKVMVVKLVDMVGRQLKAMVINVKKL